jgi:hypothetical protein
MVWARHNPHPAANGSGRMRCRRPGDYPAHLRTRCALRSAAERLRCVARWLAANAVRAARLRARRQGLKTSPPISAASAVHHLLVLQPFPGRRRFGRATPTPMTRAGGAVSMQDLTRALPASWSWSPVRPSAGARERVRRAYASACAARCRPWFLRGHRLPLAPAALGSACL